MECNLKADEKEVNDKPPSDDLARSSRPEDRITPGTAREDALQAFQASVNQPQTIFSTDFWLLPKLDRMRQLMRDPITGDEAAALIDVLYQRRWMRDLMEWLEDEPVSWTGHFIRAALRAEDDERERQEELRRQDEEWEKGAHSPFDSQIKTSIPEDVMLAEYLADSKKRYLPSASPCPTCGTPPEHLEWFQYSSPPSTWANLCGRSGWMTRCKFCLQEVDFFVGIMN